jgi:hypothetical protein
MPAAGRPGRPLAVFLRLLACLWGLALIVGVVESLVLHWPSFYWYPLFRTQDRFSDFTIFQSRFEHFGAADFSAFPAILLHIRRRLR